jgi:hypothetical protein
METNLKTAKGREDAIKKIEKNYINELRNNGFELSNRACTIIRENKIDIYLIKSSMLPDINSILTIYINDKLSILFSCPVSFDISNKSSYWKTIHAASILKNWEKFIEITNKYHKQYLELLNKIFNYG